MLEAPRRVLVLRFSSLGDVVLTSAAIDALKRAWPATEVVFAVKGAFADLVRSNPHVSQVVTMDPGEGAFSMARKLHALEADALLDLHRNNRTAALRALLRGPKRRAVWSKRPFADNLAVRLRLRPYRAAMTISERYHRAVEALAGASLPRGEMKLWVSAAHQAEADVVLAEAGLDAARPLAAISPGGTAATKLWPIERFAEIARRLAAAGAQVAVTGAKAEAPLAQAILSAVPAAKDLTGRFGIGVLGGVIARCTAFVGNDSGPMHMARALGTPSLAVFGSTDPRQFDFTGHAVLFAGVECSPCSFFGRPSCPEGHFRCMLDLDVERAWAALLPLVNAQPRRALPVHG